MPICVHLRTSQLKRILFLPLLFSTALALDEVSTKSFAARQFHTWRREATHVEASPGAGDAPMAVGSLQKPFVAKAWAAGHPDQRPPRFTCPPGPGCWNRSGHGELGLVQALSVSCNAYFRNLAAATSPDQLKATFAEEGFLGAPRSPHTAIGLYDGDSPPVIRPSRLLEAYLRLVAKPWSSGEETRQLVLVGLREAALTGTAGHIGQRGCWAKTGTVPIDPLRTCGLALVVDDSGWAILGRLEPGTGRETAECLATPINRQRPWSFTWGGSESNPGRTLGTLPAGNENQKLPAAVTVRLFELLRGRHVFLGNAGPAPIPSSNGFLGAGSRAELSVGQWAGPGLLEIQEPKSGLTRRLRGRLECRTDPEGRRTLILASTLQDYVAGVIAAELSGSSDPRRIELGAAILRFLAKGPRHPDADVCDSTHCAWFVGLGPPPQWPSPDHSRLPVGRTEVGSVSTLDWEEMQAKARLPGPSLWTSHCGGRPLSADALWGNGDMTALPCPRHHEGQSRPWQRTWSLAEVEKAFGGLIENLAIGQEKGMWVLRVTGPKGTRSLGYDEAHRRIAKVLGWGALPSPADQILPVPGGFRLTGAGLGHRVGLCLGD